MTAFLQFNDRASLKIRHIAPACAGVTTVLNFRSCACLKYANQPLNIGFRSFAMHGTFPRFKPVAKEFKCRIMVVEVAIQVTRLGSLLRHADAAPSIFQYRNESERKPVGLSS